MRETNRLGVNSQMWAVLQPTGNANGKRSFKAARLRYADQPVWPASKLLK